MEQLLRGGEAEPVVSAADDDGHAALRRGDGRRLLSAVARHEGLGARSVRVRRTAGGRFRGRAVVEFSKNCLFVILYA